MTVTLPNRVGAQRSVLDRALTAAERQDLEAVLDRASVLLSPEHVPQLAEMDDFTAANAALATTRISVLEALRGSDEAAERLHSTTPPLFDLIEQMGQSEDVVRSAEARSRNSAVRTAWESLSELQDVLSVPHLIKLGSEAVCRLGFDRAIVSQVQESTWITESIHVDGDMEWADEILAAGRQQPQILAPGLPELDLVRRRRPIVVTQVQQRAQVHRPVAEASQSRSYTAAPIMPRSKVIGFLHADRYFHRGEVTQFDCDLLGLFAQGFGFALERAMMAAQLEGMRQQIRAMSTDLSNIAGDPNGFGLSLSTDVAPAAPTQAWQDMAPMGLTPRGGAIDESDDRLTRREQEVLRLMAEGETNHRIASRLIISEGTVKSHVKHILRKLRASNRAEAVARWHTAQPR